MARPISAAVELYGPVRIVKRGPRYRVLWSEDGRQRERSATTIDRARQVALEEAGRIGVPGNATQPDVTIAALANSWLAEEHPNWGVRHRDKMRSVTRTHIIPAMGDRKASSLTPKGAQQFLNTVAGKGYSSSLVGGCLQALRGMVTHGRQLGVWGQTEDPLVGVRSPRPQADPFDLVDHEQVPTRAQVEALAEAMDRAEDALLVRVAAGCGLRWGEIINLRVRNINLSGRTIEVRKQLGEDDSGRLEERDPKSKRGVRRAPIPRDLVEDLADHIRDLDAGDRLFTSPRGGPLRRSNWNRRHWQPAHRKAGWPASLTFHNLRHFAASDWLRRGVETPDASRMLGHSSPRFTEARYVGADADHINRALELL